MEHIRLYLIYMSLLLYVSAIFKGNIVYIPGNTGDLTLLSSVKKIRVRVVYCSAAQICYNIKNPSF
jgi:hypothetical protein